MNDQPEQDKWEFIDQTVTRGGPHVIELLTCSKCLDANIHLHLFCETVQCECGNQLATKWKAVVGGSV